MKNKSNHILAILALLTMGQPTQVLAQDCASAANVAAAKSNAEVLNVAALGDGTCEVTLRIPGQNGQPPRVVTQKVNG